MERKIVAINGTIGSGKDTFAKVFINEGYHRVSFAESLKDAVSVIFGWDREMLEGNTDESRAIREQEDEFWSHKMGRPVTPRWVLQNLGTDVLRKHFHDNIWLFSLEKRILNSDSDKIIITDCRFPNEIQLVRDKSGIIIEVQRVLPSWYYDAYQYNLHRDSCDLILPKSLTDIHSSEYGWIGINKPDFIVDNNGTLEQLHQQAYNIIDSIQ